MRQQKKRVYVGMFLILLILLTIFVSSFVSADFFDWFKKTITGRASTAGTNVSISISGTNPVEIDWVWNESSASGTSNDPTERGVTTIEFNVSITDPDGVSDINDSSVRAELINASTTRVNATCAEGPSNNGTSANYSCSIDLQYWDPAGPWVINITANDLGSTTYVSNYSETFFYDVLQAIEITPGALTWPSVSGGNENQTSDNDPTLINNSGNYNATGAIAVTGINLYGATGDFISVGNLTVATTSGDSCTGAACLECDTAAPNVTVLANGTDQTITSIILEAGNLTDDSQNTVVSNASLWYCLVLVPAGLPSQSYSTTETGSADWIIKLV